MLVWVGVLTTSLFKNKLCVKLKNVSFKKIMTHCIDFFLVSDKEYNVRGNTRGKISIYNLYFRIIWNWPKKPYKFILFPSNCEKYCSNDFVFMMIFVKGWRKIDIWRKSSNHKYIILVVQNTNKPANRNNNLVIMHVWSMYVLMCSNIICTFDNIIYIVLFVIFITLLFYKLKCILNRWQLHMN